MGRKTKIMLCVLMDSLIIFGSIVSSLFLSDTHSAWFWPYSALFFFLIWGALIGGFYWSRLYHRSWKFSGTDEFKRIMKGVFFSLVLISIILTLFYSSFFSFLAFQTVLVSWFLSVIGIFSLRLLLGSYLDNKGKLNKNGKRTLIVGAGKAGLLVLKELRKTIDSPLYPVAFIDDDPEKQNLEFYGVVVAGTRKDLNNIIGQHKIELVIIAIPSAPGSDLTTIVKICKKNQVEVKILPRILDIINGCISLNMIREVKVEDLLGRPPIQLDLIGISSFLLNKTVLITGAGGSIGSEIGRQICQFHPKKLLLVGRGETSIYLITKELKERYPALLFEAVVADIQDRKRMEYVFSLHRPDVVFHAAYHKHVPLMESHPLEAIKNNIFGTKNVAECAHKYKAEKFVQISTDKAVNPTSMVGVTKRAAELMIQELSQHSSTHFTAVRFGNVLGSRGSVVSLFKQQIQEGGPVTVTHPDITRYFMTIPEAVQLVIQAGALANGGEIFVLDMGKPVKISDLAKNLICLSGLTPGNDIPIHYTGIRPGEKLFEELFTAEEGMAGSSHELLFIAKPADFSKGSFLSCLAELQKAVYAEKSEENIKEIKLLLKKLVPTYQLDSNL